jgi:serine/threonine-protein kinase
MNSVIEAKKAFNKYELIVPIGSGGMGKVFRARDRATGMELALKVLHKKWTSDRQAVRRFVSEARVIGALRHPNIVSLLEASEGADGSTPFIAMELIQGQTLAELRRRNQAPVEESQVLAWAAQASAALAVVHLENIVHRDMKPGNIMIRPDGALVLLDFGLARLPAEMRAAMDITAVKTAPAALLGTVRYMSPECARGRDAEFASDIFSLGIVLYELATGKHPFETDSEVENYRLKAGRILGD